MENRDAQAESQMCLVIRFANRTGVQAHGSVSVKAAALRPIGQGQFDTGLTGKALEEALSIAVQIFLTRGMGSLAGRVAAGEAAR